MSIKVLSIGSDRGLFKPDSAVFARIKEFGSIVGELHIVVFTLASQKFAETQLAPNVWVYPTNSFSRWFYIHDAARLGKRLVAEKRFVRGASLITTQDPFEAGWAGLQIKKKWRLPLEVQMHIDPLFSEGYDGLLDRVRKYLARRVIPAADSLRVVGEFMRARLERAFPKLTAPIYTLPVFIAPARGEEPQVDIHALYPWRFIILMVARLTPQKNIPLALRVLTKVREAYPDTGLVIAGAGKDEKSLKKLARRLGVVGHVAFAGWQSDLNSYYKTANVFLQTSRFEGYGMALVEAGLSGLPVVTTRVGIATELEDGHDAFILENENPTHFAEKITELLEHNEKRENLAINLRKTLQEKLLTKEEYLKRMKTVWEEAARHRV